MVKNTGVFFKHFNDSLERICAFLLKILRTCLSSGMYFSTSSRIIFSQFDAFSVKGGATSERSFFGIKAAKDFWFFPIVSNRSHRLKACPYILIFS